MGEPVPPTVAMASRHRDIEKCYRNKTFTTELSPSIRSRLSPQYSVSSSSESAVSSSLSLSPEATETSLLSLSSSEEVEISSSSSRSLSSSSSSSSSSSPLLISPSSTFLHSSEIYPSTSSSESSSPSSASVSNSTLSLPLLSFLFVIPLPLLTLLAPCPALGVVHYRQLGERIMTTRYGKVRGLMVEFPNNRHLRPVEAFLGLRYADLDGGAMRFMPPKNPKETWHRARVAVKSQAACPQPTRHESQFSAEVPEGRAVHLRNITPYLAEQTEDCLTLNLYVPTLGWNDTSPKAVMVYIHGETYETGSGNAYDGSVLSSFGDVIVVTLNYRLGVLGFLSTEDKAAMGNYAMMDISQALIWLRENIASFNGDPQRVTLFGHGHGAALTNLLMLSPFVREGPNPFFQRAILQSGSALATWAVSYDPTWCTQRLALSVNCSRHAGDTDALVRCIEKKPYADLVNAPSHAPKYYSCFAPSIDRWTMLPAPVRKLLKEKTSRFAEVPVMFGITKNEAYAYLKPQEITKGLSDHRKTQILRTYVQNVFRYHRQKIYEILDHHYTDWTHGSDMMANRDNVLEMLSDGQYVAPIVEMANFHSETADTYLYSFSHSTRSADGEEDDKVEGIHGDELPYVFGSPLVNGSSPFPNPYTNNELMLSEAVMTYWTNFAKTGNPNEPRNQTSVHGGEKAPNRFIDLEWPKYDKKTKEYLAIDRRPALRDHYRADKMALWLDLIPKIDRDDGSERASHELDNSDNSSTFDDYSHVLSPNLDNSIFPSPPPMPPVRPTPFDRKDGGYKNNGMWTTQARGDPWSGGGSGSGNGRDGVGGYPTVDGGVNNSMWGNGDGRGQGRGDSGSISNGGRRNSGFGDSNTGYSDEGNPASELNSEENDENKDSKPAAGGDTDSSTGAKSSGVPLSMVVAIGGSLLLINLLIFAGLCYQRERIRRMRRLDKTVLAPPDGDYDDDAEGRGAVGGSGLTAADRQNSQKLLGSGGSNQGSPSMGARGSKMGGSVHAGAPECMSLISAAGSSSSQHPHHHHGHSRGNSPFKPNGHHQHQSNTHIHNPSPQPSTEDVLPPAVGGSNVGRRTLSGYSANLTPPPLASVDSSGSSSTGGCEGGGKTGGPSFVPVTSGGYSTVPTNVTSPIHRAQTYSPGGGTSKMGNGPSKLSTPAKVGGADNSTYANSQIPSSPAPPYEEAYNQSTIPGRDDLRQSPRLLNTATGTAGGRNGLPVGRGNGVGGLGLGGTGVAMTTFGTAAGRGGGAGALNRGNVPGGGLNPNTASTIGSSTTSSGAPDPVYKKINKAGPNNTTIV